MNTKLALIVIPICFSIAFLGGRLPHFKQLHHSKPQPIIKALEESTSEDSKNFVEDVGPGNSRLDFTSEKAYPFFEVERVYHSKFKLVNIVARPPPAVFC